VKQFLKATIFQAARWSGLTPVLGKLSAGKRLSRCSTRLSRIACSELMTRTFGCSLSINSSGNARKDGKLSASRHLSNHRLRILDLRKCRYD